MGRIAILLVIVSLVVCTAQAAVVGPVFVNPNSTFSATIGSTPFTCAQIGSYWLAGEMNSSVANLFTPYSIIAKQRRAEYRSLKPSKRKQAIEKLTKFIKRAAKLCKLGPPSGSSSSSVSSGQMSSQSSSLAAQAGNFDSAGNVTERGRVKFGIPAGLPANITIGRQYVQQSCIGCHAEKVGLSFSTYRAAIANPPMGFTTAMLPDEMLAHMTAYLRRFEQN